MKIVTGKCYIIRMSYAQEYVSEWYVLITSNSMNMLVYWYYKRLGKKASIAQNSSI